MADFIVVQSYLRGYSFPPEHLVLNVPQIVSFHQCYFNGDDGEQVPYVSLNTTQQRGLSIAITLDELLALIEGKEGA
jgi:hypothetical protein